MQPIRFPSFVSVLAVLTVGLTGSPHSFIGQQTNEKSSTANDKIEMCECELLVVDEDGVPIQNAEITGFGLRPAKYPSAHFLWPKELLGKKYETDEFGKATVLYPKFVYDDLLHGDNLSFRVTWLVRHPRYVPFDEDRAVAIYHRIRPAFRTTFSANNRQRYMQVEVTLVTRSEEVVSALVTHQPLIVNALVMLFADADYLELQTAEGKETLRLAAIAAVDAILEEEAEVGGIEKVLFTQSVMQ